MKVTGSLQVKNGIYQMMLRVEGPDGVMRQKSKTTGIKAQGRNSRDSRQNRLRAEQMLASYILELSTASTPSTKLEFLQAIEAWLEHKKKELRQDTYEAYMCNYNAHIRPYFLPKKFLFTDVTPRILARYVDDKLEEGQSACSIRKHLVIFNGVFKEALRYGEIQTNPCANITVKDHKERFEGTAYTPKTAKLLLGAIKDDPLESAVYLGLYLGLRRSEVAGLRWMDVDFDNDLVHVRNTVVRFSTISELEKTKNPTSKRDLYLPQGLKAYLLEHRARCKAVSPADHVCQYEDGKPFKPDYISHRFKKVLEKTGLPIIRFHDLRHTAGSMLINEGHTILQVQNFLGHKKASTTLDIYSHVYLEGKKQTASKLDELLSD